MRPFGLALWTTLMPRDRRGVGRRLRREPDDGHHDDEPSARPHGDRHDRERTGKQV